MKSKIRSWFKNLLGVRIKNIIFIPLMALAIQILGTVYTAFSMPVFATLDMAGRSQILMWPAVLGLVFSVAFSLNEILKGRKRYFKARTDLFLCNLLSAGLLWLVWFVISLNLPYIIS